MKTRGTMATVKLLIAADTIKQLLVQIQKIEDDVKTPDIEKLSQIKKIREEITKVGTEIDMLEKELILLNTHCVN